MVQGSSNLFDRFDVKKISDITISHYDSVAHDFWEGTRDHDVSQNYESFLGAIEQQPPFSILDFGCGPGRDLKYFSSLGHEATGLDGSEEFVRMGREFSGCPILHQDFLSMDLPLSKFDGIFANASLFHIPSGELPRILLELYACLKPKGVMFSSNPRGDNDEGFKNGRYGCFLNLETWRKYMTTAGFVELQHYFRPAGLQCRHQPWLASVWRKI